METSKSFEDKVLSTVHVLTKSSPSVAVSSSKREGETDNHKPNNPPIKDTFMSRFFFSVPSTTRDHFSQLSEPRTKQYQEDNNCENQNGSRNVTQEAAYYSDDDSQEAAAGPSNPSTDQNQREVLTIEHKMATSITDVGFQVWSGALLLCDYILHHPTQLHDCTVLDMGSGPGLTSFIAAMFAHTVICTDYSSEIIRLAESNWERNKDLIPKAAATISSPKVLFKILDWSNNHLYPVVQPLDSKSSQSVGDTTTPTDHLLDLHKPPQPDDYVDDNLLEQVKVILAAEVVYDEDLTDAFFRTLYHLLVVPPAKAVFMSLEKRIVYSTAAASVCSPAYSHFRENLEDLISVDPRCSQGGVSFTAARIDTDFPCCFEYDRMKELELWKISSHFN